MATTKAIKLGSRGETLIKEYERLRLVAYLPTPQDKPTIGWGHTRGVKLGDTCTVEQADRWFREDTAEAVAVVAELGVPLTQSMVDALVSIIYNAGPLTVSARNTIGRTLRARDYFSAWAGFALWRKQAGEDKLGLARRRAKEMVLFFEGGLPR